MKRGYDRDMATVRQARKMLEGTDCRLLRRFPPPWSAEETDGPDAAA